MNQDKLRAHAIELMDMFRDTYPEMTQQIAECMLRQMVKDAERTAPQREAAERVKQKRMERLRCK